ncbi:cation-transporting ATPase [Clavibacter sepedonicus]|uniref:Uncharacterized protein n=1 Tax=Clavibacter sepedonicus TaxID=31964 RepID=B0RBS9_CLASE|nr:hypothetical protein [Clavibacter sepedonicus]OQJ48906.1 hypothetical protein B5P19_12110 [Clavibacter sepedonicus]OQJ53783.1 hypothetical protein B5P20_06340 [Clavibacter sepedonicus]UUK65289.1 cation-transporting ATPase [Clavibacter sepedonicus]CAQ00480.1 conserved hypothetical protein [Clavibacter sepedonicus]
MPDFSKLLGAAARALGNASSSSRDGRQQRPVGAPGSGSGTDWRGLVRTAAGHLGGDDTSRAQPTASPHRAATADARPRTSEADRVALGKYDYLLRTADPDQLEQVHRDAFARLTPEQRDLVQARLTEELPAHERPRSGGTDDLARAATRGETAHPGLMQRVFGGGAAGGADSRPGAGPRGGSRMGAFAGGAAAGAGVAALGGLAIAVAGGAAVSSVAGPLLSGALADGVDFAGLAEGFGLEGLTGLTGLTDGIDGVSEGVSGLTEGVDGLAQGGAEHLTGIGDGIGGLGDSVGGLAEGFRIPGLDDLFGR